MCGGGTVDGALITLNSREGAVGFPCPGWLELGDGLGTAGAGLGAGSGAASGAYTAATSAAPAGGLAGSAVVLGVAEVTSCALDCAASCGVSAADFAVQETHRCAWAYQAHTPPVANSKAAAMPIINPIFRFGCGEAGVTSATACGEAGITFATACGKTGATFATACGEDAVKSATACGANGGVCPTPLTGSHSGIGIGFGPKDGVLLHGVSAAAAIPA